MGHNNKADFTKEMNTPTATSNKDIERIYRGFEILRSSAGERELPAQLLSTFLWAASHDGCYQSELTAATSMSSSSVPALPNLNWSYPLTLNSVFP